MSKREKHEKPDPMVAKVRQIRESLPKGGDSTADVRASRDGEDPTPTENAQDAAVGESLAPIEPPKFGPAWLGEPRAVPDAPPAIPTQPMEVDAGPLTPADRCLLGRLEQAYAEDMAAVADFIERQRVAREAAASESVPCTTCGNPVAPGATCEVDGQVAPS